MHLNRVSNLWRISNLNAIKHLNFRLHKAENRRNLLREIPPRFINRLLRSIDGPLYFTNQPTVLNSIRRIRRRPIVGQIFRVQSSTRAADEQRKKKREKEEGTLSREKGERGENPVRIRRHTIILQRSMSFISSA